MGPIDPSAPATRGVRYRVVGFAVLLAMVTYLDRACIATLAPYIMDELGLSKDEMSLIYSAFALAYAAFEIPTAWWADRSRHAPGPHAHRPLVVRLYNAHGGGMELYVAGCDAVLVWRGRGGRLAERGADVLALGPAPERGRSRAFSSAARTWRAA